MEQSVYQAKEEFLLREIAGESVLIPTGESSMNSNRIFSLNEESTYLWKAFAEPRTIADVVKEAMEIYDASEEVLTKDVTAFVQDYVMLGLMQKTES